MPNIINSLNLELEFSSTKSEATEKSDSYYHNHVLPVIERVCKKFGGVSVFIEGILDIELGEVSEANLAYSLENALETALIKWQHSQNATDIAQKEVFNEVEFFFNYLQMPRLHWASESDSSFNFSLVLGATLREIAQSKALLQRLVATVAKNISVLQRFVYLSANESETETIVMQIIQAISSNTYQQFETAHILLGNKVFAQNADIKKQVYLFWLQSLLFGRNFGYNYGYKSEFHQYKFEQDVFYINRILSKNLASSEIDVFTNLIFPVYSRLIEENALNISDIHFAYPNIENIKLLFEDYSISVTTISSDEKGEKVKDKSVNQQQDEQLPKEKELEFLESIDNQLDKQTVLSEKSNIEKKEDEEKPYGNFENNTKQKGIQQNKLTTKAKETSTSKLFNKEINYLKDVQSPLQISEELFLTENKRIPVYNSGLVILQPFLVSLFDKLKLLDNRTTFKSIESQLKAIHILQAITGDKSEHFEHLLYLNKVICGMDILFPIDSEYSISDIEKTEIQNLLKSVIRHWKIIRNTSVAGFQNSFLSRKGYLEKSSIDWILRVETQGIDVLLEDIPWNINTLSFPWNDYLIYVDWKMG